MKIDVLDHGYVALIESWGRGSVPNSMNDGFRCDSDYERGIVEAARQSTQGSFRGWDQDARLLRRLWTGRPNDDPPAEWQESPRHATPFEFAGMVIEVQAPLFVFREWHRHRTQSYNEMSARYTPLPDLYYVPDHAVALARTHAASVTKNKQEAGSVRMTAEQASDVALDWIRSLRDFYRTAETNYRAALASGVPNELARASMPVGHYSRMRASANLRNWLAFLTLRMDPAAQWEIRQYANALGEIVRETFPRTWQLFRWEES